MGEEPDRGVVLVVDDDEDYCATLAEVLSLDGYHAECFTKAQDALSYLQTQPLPLVILLDWVMPAMSGEQFLTALHQDSRLENLRVVIVSGLPRLVPPDTGRYPVLRKPFFLEELLGLLPEG
jgi:CheY-like chemotaxis protein